MNDDTTKRQILAKLYTGELSIREAKAILNGNETEHSLLNIAKPEAEILQKFQFNVSNGISTCLINRNAVDQIKVINNIISNHSNLRTNSHINIIKPSI